MYFAKKPLRLLVSAGLAAAVAGLAGLAAWFQYGRFPIVGAVAVWLVFTGIGMRDFGRRPRAVDRGSPKE